MWLAGLLGDERDAVLAAIAGIWQTIRIKEGAIPFLQGRSHERWYRKLRTSIGCIRCIRNAVQLHGWQALPSMSAIH